MTEPLTMPRSSPLKPIWVLLTIFMALLIIAALMKVFEPRDIVPWRSEFAAAQAEAVEQNKPMLIYFTARWCGPCQRMATTTWAERALQDFVPVKIDIEQNPTLAIQFGVEPLPAFVVLRLDEQTMRMTDGFYDSRDFITWLRGGPERPLM
jgi:thiol-disulfide isomerase/thioredoxin